jgi:hypothetical protein
MGAVLAACSGGSNSASPGGDAGRPVDAGADKDSSTTDGALPEAASDGEVGGGVISAPADTWTWVDVPGAVCGNGSKTGVGVNLHPGATHLVILLNGGSACTDATSCWGPNSSSTYMQGFGATQFSMLSPNGLAIFTRMASAGNPWADADWVFVPFCTGDFHIGTALAMLAPAADGGSPIPTYFYGAKNIAADTAALASSLKGLTHVWLVGVSAGGFGAFLNQQNVTNAFPGIPVDIVDDSGPAVQLYGGADVVSLVPWGVQLPTGCTGCQTLPDIYAFDRKTYPNSKFGFLTYQTDSQLPTAFMVSESAFAMQIQTFISSMASDPNAKSFQAASTGHVVMAGADATANPYILPWLTQMANDDPAWANVVH